MFEKTEFFLITAILRIFFFSYIGSLDNTIYTNSQFAFGLFFR